MAFGLSQLPWEFLIEMVQGQLLAVQAQGRTVPSQSEHFFFSFSYVLPLHLLNSSPSHLVDGLGASHLIKAGTK